MTIYNNSNSSHTIARGDESLNVLLHVTYTPPDIMRESPENCFRMTNRVLQLLETGFTSDLN